ncbi:hypothetical protein SAMN04515659_3955 [Dyella sp. 333MFSha]|nr:hypothetical protein SAMN04515659_3955 [Dyella sp. 333MFSha]
MAIIGVLIAIAAYLNIVIYQEYFGDGPPYFGRQENLDKWVDPRGWLALSDAVLGCAVWKVAISIRRLRR